MIIECSAFFPMNNFYFLLSWKWTYKIAIFSLARQRLDRLKNDREAVKLGLPFFETKSFCFEGSWARYFRSADKMLTCWIIRIFCLKQLVAFISCTFYLSTVVHRIIFMFRKLMTFHKKISTSLLATIKNISIDVIILKKKNKNGVNNSDAPY